MADDGQRVIIAGAGVAGIEAALALRALAGGRVLVDLHDPRREFVYRPFAVGEPYGAAPAFRYDLNALADRCGASLHPGGIVSVDAERRLALSRDGARWPYDHLILAPGVRMLWAVPGAVTFWGVADEGQVGGVIADLRAGALERVAFTMPAGNTWALPLYELALLAQAEVAKVAAARAEIVVVTPEGAPLEVFGVRVGERMGDLLAERGIELVTGAHPIKFEAGRLHLAPNRALAADAVISLPRLEGRRVGGVPRDADGFIGVDGHCRVLGLERVYAVGDVTSFPVKQGGIASQQADAVAEAIAAAAGADVDPQPFDPVLRGVLWTGGSPRYLYGRLTGGHGDVSAFSERPLESPGSGKIVARHLTSLLDQLTAEGDPPEDAGRASLNRAGSHR